MATPSGLPAWSRAASAETYGGIATKTNYQSQGATNGRTDWAAEEFLRLTADAAACTRTCPFGAVKFTPDDITPAHPTVTRVDLMSGTQSVSYLGNAAPTGFPAVTRNGDGDYTVTFPTSVTDEFGVSQAVNIRGAGPTMDTDTAALATHVLVNAYTVRVYVWDVAGSPLGDQAVQLRVW